MDADVVVVGAGLAGLRCAERLAEAGREVVVLEREPVVGGRQQTDEVDGFLLDRGFQVLNPAYPAVRRWVDVDDLALRPFGAGLLVRREHGLVRLHHPLREPRGLAATLRSGLLAPGSAAARPGGPRRRCWRPSASPTARTGRWRGPGPGRRPRPAARGGARAVPRRRRRRGPRRDVEAFVRLFVRCSRWGAGRRRAASAPCPSGSPTGCAAAAVPPTCGLDAGHRHRRHRRRAGRGVRRRRPGRRAAVVVAVGPEAMAGLIGMAAPETHGLRTWWFAADEPPTTSDLVTVDGRRRGPMVDAAVVSNAVPSYARPSAPW